jgi:hypothetical protein
MWEMQSSSVNLKGGKPLTDGLIYVGNIKIGQKELEVQDSREWTGFI